MNINQLIAKGLVVGSNFSYQSRCSIDPSHCWLISIGNNVTFSSGVVLLAHDASTKMHLGYTKLGGVKIGNKVFIGANTVVLPDVIIGENSIIGAGSVVTNHIPANSVAAGNPAKVIGNTDVYIEKHRNLMKTRKVYEKEWTIAGKITHEQKQIMCEQLKEESGYVV